MKKTAADFIDYISRGREIEFEIHGHKYFASNQGLENLFLYDCENGNSQYFSSGQELFDMALVCENKKLRDIWNFVTITDVF